MRTIREMSQYKRDLKRVKRSGERRPDDVEDVILMLAADSPLPGHLRDHALSGVWRKVSARECHIRPNLLLIYAKPPGELHLLRLGSHPELFK